MNDKSNPKIYLPKQPLDIIYSSLAIIGLFFIWTYSIIQYQKLPDYIPVHFSDNGFPNGYGSKNSIWFIPMIVTFLNVLFFVIVQFPHKFNYLVKITENNAEKQYRLATRVMRFMQFSLTVLFTFIAISTVQGAKNKFSQLEWWFIPGLLLSSIVPTFYMIFKSGSKNYK